MINSSDKQVPPTRQVHLLVCVCVCEGSSGGAPQHFVMAHLTKQRQLTFLVLCHILYSGTSRVSSCKDPITPCLSLSLLGVLVRWRASRGVPSLQTDQAIWMQSLSCHKSMLPAPLLSSPPFYYFAGFHSYFSMGGLSPPRISTGDMSSKCIHRPMWPLT